MTDRDEAAIHGVKLEQVKFDEILQLFNALADLESSFAELYEACGNHWVEDAEFWFSIAQEERNHAVYVKQLSELVSQFPNQFTQGTPFNPISLMTTGRTTKIVIQKINNSQITRKEIFNIALDIEKSVLETNYTELLKTNNKQYLDVAKTLVMDNSKHQEMIQQKIEELF